MPACHSARSARRARVEQRVADADDQGARTRQSGGARQIAHEREVGPSGAPGKFAREAPHHDLQLVAQPARSLVDRIDLDVPAIAHIDDEKRRRPAARPRRRSPRGTAATSERPPA